MTEIPIPLWNTLFLLAIYLFYRLLLVPPKGTVSKCMKFASASELTFSISTFIMSLMFYLLEGSSSSMILLCVSAPWFPLSILLHRDPKNYRKIVLGLSFLRLLIPVWGWLFSVVYFVLYYLDMPDAPPS